MIRRPPRSTPTRYRRQRQMCIRDRLKEVGKRARRDIEMLLGSKVYLELWVKVQKDWRNKVNFIRQMGYVEDQD